MIFTSLIVLVGLHDLLSTAKMAFFRCEVASTGARGLCVCRDRFLCA